MIHSSWDIEFDRLKLVIMSHFMPFYPSPLKPKKSESWKKKLQEISSFYMCTKNQSYEVRFLRYRVSQTEFLSFWAIFALLLPLSPTLTTQKIQILKKRKKCLEILSLYTCILLMKIMWCMVPEIRNVTDRIYSHFRKFVFI